MLDRETDNQKESPYQSVIINDFKKINVYEHITNEAIVNT